MPKYVEVKSTIDFANTFLNDIFFRMAVNRVLDAAPAADVAEVVHGQWIIDKEHLRAACSECGNTLRFSDEMQIALLGDNERFCYYCGADMRERKEDAAE